MRLALAGLAIMPALLLAGLPTRTDAIETDPFWGVICASPDEHQVALAAFSEASVPPVARCDPAPTKFEELPSVGGPVDASVTLDVGFDATTSRLCYVNRTLAQAPVIHVGAGHRLQINLTNTLHNTGTQHQLNCGIELFGGGTSCENHTIFREQPGADGDYYPIAANQAHTADGTTNLHTHGLTVSPQPCSDEVLRSTIYPANWTLPVVLQPCQTAPNTFTYTYDLPADHPAGLYWYHTHRHGTAEQQTQMGLVGALIVEDENDAHRRALGVTDEVLVVTDTPLNCTTSICGDIQPVAARTLAAWAAARQAARQAAAKAPAPDASTGAPTLDPRIDEVDQAGSCALGAVDSSGGYELWTLLLNGAPVQDNEGGVWPPDFEVLSKTMQPGQRQLFRLVNASADSFVAPQMALLHNNHLTIEKLEVYARDGVGLLDANGNRHYGRFDVATNPLVVPPSGRVEFVVHAPPAGDTLYLQSSQVNPGCAGNRYPPRRLLRITSTGTPVDPGEPDDRDLFSATPRLRNYVASLNGTPSVSRTFVLSEYSRPFTYGLTKWLNGPPTASDYNPNQVDFYLTQVAATDGQANLAKTALVPFTSHMLRPQVVVHLHGQSSVTEQWLVENATLEAHAFHIHQIHFRDVTVDSTDPDLQPVLDVDTVPPAQLVGDVATGYPGEPGYVKLLMTFTTADIGEFVFHCHILEHEDNGMMAKIQVVAD